MSGSIYLYEKGITPTLYVLAPSPPDLSVARVGGGTLTAEYPDNTPHHNGKMVRLEKTLATALTIDPLATISTRGPVTLAPGESYVAPFTKADDGYYMAFSTDADMNSGSSDFTSAIDVLDYKGRVFRNDSTRKIATSMDPRGLSNYGYAGLRHSPKQKDATGSCLFAFRPEDYIDPDNGLRYPPNSSCFVRVRSVPAFFSHLGTPVGHGGDFTLKYWLHENDWRYTFAFTPEEPTPGASVTFRADLYGADASTRWEWDWDDGSPLETTVTPDATHTFASAGDYVVSLKSESVIIKAHEEVIWKAVVSVQDDTVTDLAYVQQGV